MIVVAGDSAVVHDITVCAIIDSISSWHCSMYCSCCQVFLSCCSWGYIQNICNRAGLYSRYRI